MKKINFKTLPVQFNIEGEPEIFDATKIVGNPLHAMSYDIALHDLGRTIYYSEGEVEIPTELILAFLTFVKKSDLIFAPVKVAIIGKLS